MVRPVKRTSIAHANTQTTLTRSAVDCMKDLHAEMVSNKGKIKGRNEANSKANSKVSNRDNSRGSKVNEVNSRDNRDSQDSKVPKVVNRKAASRQAVRKTAASRKATGTAAALIVQQRWVAATGAMPVNFPPRYASDYVKRRICDASGARPVWAPNDSTK